MVNKATHGAMLLLSAYYNYYGDTQFYLLLCQRCPGQGDKETFPGAAMALDLPYFQVSGVAGYVGTLTPANHIEDVIVQFNPQDDYEGQRINPTRLPVDRTRRVLFMHNRGHKADASDMADLVLNRYKTRIWGPLEYVQENLGIDYDLERGLWDEMMVTACANEHDFEAWSMKTDVCGRARKAYSLLFEGGAPADLGA